MAPAGSEPSSIGSKMPVSGGAAAMASISDRVFSCATIVAPGSQALPAVWSGWLCVLTRVCTGPGDTVRRAAANARVRRSVEQVSTATVPDRPTSIPVLLIIQPPSGCT